jgi:hypothetical protein
MASDVRCLLRSPKWEEDDFVFTGLDLANNAVLVLDIRAIETKSKECSPQGFALVPVRAGGGTTLPPSRMGRSKWATPARQNGLLAFVC